MRRTRGSRRGPRLMRRAIVSCEPLERRTLLSTLVVSGTGEDDAITLDVTAAGGVRTVVNGVSTDYAAGQWTDVAVNSGAGDDTINIKATVVPTLVRYAEKASIQVGDASGVQDIKSALTINNAVPGPVRADQAADITLDDSGDATARSISLAAPTGPIETITGLSPAEIDISRVNPFDTATAPSTDSLTLISGSGADSMDVHGLLPNLITSIRNSGGNDTVDVGDGSLAGIESPVLVGKLLGSDGAGTINLAVDDSQNQSPAQFELQARYPLNAEQGPFGTIRWGASVATYVDFAAQDVVSATVDGGAGGNAFTINGVVAGSSSGQGGPGVTLNTGSGDDSVTVNLIERVQPLVVNGGAGNDTLTVSNFLNMRGTVQFDGGREAGSSDTLVLQNPPDSTGAPAPAVSLTAGMASNGHSNVQYTNVHTVHVQSGQYLATADIGAINLVVGQDSGAAAAAGASPDPTAVEFGATQNLDALQILDGTVTLLAGGSKVLNTDMLSLDTGTLDLTNNSLQVHYGAADPFAVVRQSIFNQQIKSDLADAAHNLGYADSADGVVSNLAAHTVLVKYALYGDANLDGKVGFDDLVLLARNYGKNDANWDQGDFNYDGHVGFDDLVKLARNYGRSIIPPTVPRPPAHSGRY